MIKPKEHISIPGIEPEVYRIGYGTYHLLDKLNASQALDSFGEAFDSGINLFDTSDNYGTELVLGRAVSLGILPRDEVVIATKTGLGTTVTEQKSWNEQKRRANTEPTRIKNQVENSLRVLGTDVGIIDIYQLHVRDDNVEHIAHAEVMAELIDKQKIKAWGVSNYSNQELQELIEVCDNNKLPRPVTSQPFHNLLDSSSENKIDLAANLGIITLAHSPLLKGVLTDKRSKQLINAFNNITEEGSEKDKLIVEEISPTTEKLSKLIQEVRDSGTNLARVAIAWTLRNPNVISLTAATNDQYLKDAIEALYLDFSPEIEAKIDDLRSDSEALDYFQKVTHGLIRQIRQY